MQYGYAMILKVSLTIYVYSQSININYNVLITDILFSFVLFNVVFKRHIIKPSSAAGYILCCYIVVAIATTAFYILMIDNGYN